MDHHSSFDEKAISGRAQLARSAASPARSRRLAPSLSSRKVLRFPGEDGGASFEEMAQLDFLAALQLLAERALYITGASGAAIALLEGDEMLCRASAGPSAPEVGSEVPVSSGLTRESVQTRRVLRCDDADRDSRVNQESCQGLGIRSVMVVPLIREGEVVGIFELLAERPHAFEERDVTALQRLSETILTALQHIDAANRPPIEIVGTRTHELIAIATQNNPSTLGGSNPAATLPAPEIRAPEVTIEPKTAPTESARRDELAKLRRCQTCGFPVSGARTVCLDCEKTESAEGATSTQSAVPTFLSELATDREQSWWQSNIYTIGALLVLALTLVLLVLKMQH